MSVCCVLALAFLGGAAQALDLPGTGSTAASRYGPFRPTAQLERSAAGPGGSSAVVATIKIPERTHLTADIAHALPSLRPSSPAPAGISFGQVAVPPPVKIDLDLTPDIADPAQKLYEKDVLVYQKEVTVRLPFTVAADAAPGPRTLQVTLHYQGCQEAPLYNCFMEAEEPYSFAFTVLAQPEAPAAAPATGPPAETPPAAVGALPGGLATGSLWALLALFAAGAASTLLPCVYPLIPITLTIIGARKAESRLQALALAALYGAGMVTLYVTLGLLAGLAGGQFDQWISHPAVVLSIAVLCGLLGFSMFGTFELALPASWQTRLSQVGGRGYAGAWAMGVVSGLLGSACVGPVLIAVLAFIAQTGSWLKGMLYLGAYSLGFALPYVVLGVTAASLPKPGAWMAALKKVGGLILLAVGIYYAAKVLPRYATYLLSGVTAVAAGVFAGAFDTLLPESSAWPRICKTFGVLAVASGLFTLAVGALEAGVIQLPVTPTPEPQIAWEHDPHAALAAAARDGLPVILDFRADTCTVCKQMEKTTFKEPRVVRRSKDFAMLSVDTTGGKWSDLSECFGVRGLPTVLFLDAKGRERKDLAHTGGYLGAEELLRKMAVLVPPAGG